MDFKDLQRQFRSNCHCLPKFIFRFVGISVSDTEGKLYKIYTLVVFVVACLYPTTCLHLTLTSLNNYNVVIGGIFNVVGGITVCSKLIIIHKNKKNLKKIFDDIETFQLQKNTKGWRQAETYKMNKMILTVALIFYSIMFFICAGTLTARFIVNDPNKWVLPICDFSLFDTTYSPNFEIAWFYHSIAALVGATVYCFADFLIAGLIIDLTTQYTVLTETIRAQFESLYPTKNNKPCYEELNDLVRNIVSHHTSLIELTTRVNAVGSSLVFVTAMASLVTVSSALYYASVFPMRSAAALISCFEVLAVTSSLFVLSYFGTQLSTASQNVANACYELDFVGLDVRFQKSLVLIIMRSQRPAWLSVGGFTNLSIGVFVWMVRSTYSYCMILRKNQQVKEGAIQ